MRPQDFTFGDATSGGWLVGGRVYEHNPRRLLTPADHAMVRVWLACRPSGMGGARLLPDAGGVLDQAAVMLDALGIMDDEAARLQRREEPARA
jgi:hypothetical protein